MTVQNGRLVIESERKASEGWSNAWTKMPTANSTPISPFRTGWIWRRYSVGSMTSVPFGNGRLAPRAERMGARSAP